MSKACKTETARGCHKSLRRNVVVTCLAFFTSSVSGYTRFYILLLCIHVADWALPILTAILYVALTIGALMADWVLVLRLRILGSEHFDRARLLFLLHGLAVVSFVCRNFVSLWYEAFLSDFAFVLFVAHSGFRAFFYGYATWALWSEALTEAKNATRTSTSKWLKYNAVAQGFSACANLLGSISQFLYHVGTYGFSTHTLIQSIEYVVGWVSFLMLVGILVRHPMESMFDRNDHAEAERVVHALAKRAMTASGLLEFCSTKLRDRIPNFNAKTTTTNDQEVLLQKK